MSAPRKRFRLSKANVERIVGAFEAGADWSLAAKLVGSTRRTLERAVSADEAVSERVRDARDAADDVVVKSLYTKATVDKDTTAMIFWLKNRRPAEWRDRHDMSVEGRIESADVTSPEVRDARLMQILAAAAARRDAGAMPTAVKP